MPRTGPKNWPAPSKVAGIKVAAVVASVASTGWQLIYTTWPDVETAKAAAATLLQEKLIACANIFAPHPAVYEWQGAVQSESEVAVLFKAPAQNAQPLQQRIAALHPYETPAILHLNVAQAPEAFLAWANAHPTQWGQ